MILVAGEILFDIFPDSRRIGGAPFNFAYHLKQLGHDVRFVSRVGKDDLGTEILGFLEAHEFDIRDIQIDSDLPTGRVDITLHSDGSHDFTIAQNTAYDRLCIEGRLEELSCAPWQMFYTGTLIQRNTNNARVIRQILESKPEGAQCFCDINLRPGCYTAGSIQTCLAQADILKINDAEFHEVTDHDCKEVTLDESISQLMASYSFEHVILTKGRQGSQWFTGQSSFTGPVPEMDHGLRDTVGAGDAYAAMAAAGILNRLPPEKTMLLAQEFAGRICGIQGAIPEDPGMYPYFKRRLIP